jgi:hypothetical protein
VRHAASRAIHNPVARRIGKGFQAAHRALGHGKALVDFGRNVGKTFGSARTAAHDIRQALRTHKLSDVKKAFHSTKEAFGSAGELVASASGARSALRAGARTLHRIAPKTYGRLAHAASRALQKSGLARGAQALRRTASRLAHSSLGKRLDKGLQLGRKVFKHANTLYNFGRSVAQLPGQGRTAFRDLRQAIRTHSAADIHKALESARSFAGGVRDVIHGAKDARDSLRAGWRAFSRAAPKLSARLGRAATQALRRSGVRELGRIGARAAGRVGSHAAVRAAARIGGKALGRFAPGANIAMAAADTASFFKTLSDKHASKTQKILAGIRAAGSIAAATNIPIVSQAGAAISTVADIASSLHLPKVHLPKIHLW